MVCRFRDLATLHGLFLMGVVAAPCDSGCSLVYSPFVTAPPAPLTKGEGGVSATANVFPKTYPQIGESIMAASSEFLARYAFSDRSTLQGRLVTAG